MWSWEGIQEGIRTPQLSASAIKARKEAEEKINKEGRGICKYCREEIVKNLLTNADWTWESESMVGYCEKSTNKSKHEPLVKYNIEEGVHNA